MELYRWIKASERLPEEDKFKIDDYDRQCIRIKIDGNRSVTTGYYDHEEKRWYYFNDEPITEKEIEWLEPIGESNQDELWDDIVARVQAADMMAKVTPGDNEALERWKKKAIDLLSSKYLLIKH